MREDLDRLVTAVEAAHCLGISLSTLGRMERKGHLLPYRTIGGHRRYSLAMLNDYLARSRERRTVADDVPRGAFASPHTADGGFVPSLGASRSGADAEPAQVGMSGRLPGRGSSDHRGEREASRSGGAGDAGNELSR